MAVSYQPVIGDWYMSLTGETFEVVAYDQDEDAVEIQYFDGSVEELDLDTWLAISVEPIEPPEDWTGSVDVMREDSGPEDRATPFSPGNPLDDPSLF